MQSEISYDIFNNTAYVIFEPENLSSQTSIFPGSWLLSSTSLTTKFLIQDTDLQWWILALNIVICNSQKL